MVKLRGVAFVVFAARGRAGTALLRAEAWQQPDVPYPVGSLGVPTPCADASQT